MDPTPCVPETLARRVRRLRIERELTQQELGHLEFSRHYVNAVERGRVQPSTATLQLLAARLAVGPETLQAVATPPALNPTPALVAEDMAYQLAQLRPLLNKDPASLLQQLEAIAQEYARFLRRVEGPARFWFHYLYGAAHLRSGEPCRAIPKLAAALAAGAHACEDLERARNAMGAAFFMLDQPAQALKWHEQCLQAICPGGAIQDKNLRLLVYTNLAADYWALNDSKQAIAYYQEALTLVDEVQNDERRAAIYWGLGLAYQAQGNLDRAKLYTYRALELQRALKNRANIAQLSINLAEIMIPRHEYETAERLLDQAQAILRVSGDSVNLSDSYQCYALLELERGRIAQAAAFAREGVQLTEPLVQQPDGLPGTALVAHAQRCYARALHVRALVAEREGQREHADATFQQALAVLGRAEYDETASEIEQRYADVLDARGDFIGSVIHYRAAWQRLPQRAGW